MQEKLNSICRMISSASVSVDENESANNVGKDNFEMIKKYKELYDEGIISEEEFNKKKQELLKL